MIFKHCALEAKTRCKRHRKWNEDENFGYLGNGRKTEMIKLVEEDERKKVFVHN